MEIEISTRSSAKRELLKAVTALYARMLKIENSKFSVVVSMVPGFAKEMGMNGAACLVEDRVVAVALDSRLPMEQLLITLAHEMVHVKQRAKGQLKSRYNRKGEVVWSWMGRDYNTHYFDSPWELEAFSRERVMANKVAHIILEG
jgi:hypothetical protein